MAQENVKVWPAVTILSIVFILCSILSATAIIKNVNNAVPTEIKATVDLTDVNAKLDSLLNKSSEVSNVLPTIVLTKTEQEEEANEVKALELSTNFVNSNDFKKATENALLDFNVSIENYKDITEVKILESDVNEDGEDTEVIFDVKVTYFIDGDEDEVQEARLKDFVVTFDELDYDKDFEDAEVVQDDTMVLEVLKVYD